MNKILMFKDKFNFLSNFYPSIIYYESYIYPTVEHAFQASKTIDKELKEIIRDMLTAGKAKKYGRYVPLRIDWEDIKLNIMEEILKIKFTLSSFKEKLLATENIELIEGNYWNDQFWGFDLKENKGQNHLGKILMKIRDELKNGKPINDS